MTTQYFEPRPPKVTAVKLSAASSVDERMEQLRGFGIRKVTVESVGTDDYRFIVTPHEGCGDEIILEGIEDRGHWLVAIITETDSWVRKRTVEVKLISEEALYRVYQPVAS